MIGKTTEQGPSNRRAQTAGNEVDAEASAETRKTENAELYPEERDPGVGRTWGGLTSDVTNIQQARELKAAGLPSI
jgi:hypothetical protein